MITGDFQQILLTFIDSSISNQSLNLEVNLPLLGRFCSGGHHCNLSYPLPCGRYSWLPSVGSRLAGDFSSVNPNLFYYWRSNLRGHSHFHHGNAEQYLDDGILSTIPQCFSYYNYASWLEIESSAGHDYEVRDYQSNGTNYT